MAPLLRRLRTVVFVGAILGSVWLLGAALFMVLATDLTLPNPPVLAIVAALALYPSLFWWKSQRDETRWAVRLSDALAGALQLGSAVWLFLCVRASLMGPHATGPAGYGQPMLATMASAWIAAITFAAVMAIQAHGYVSHRWPAARVAADATAGRSAIERRASVPPADLS